MQSPFEGLSWGSGDVNGQKPSLCPEAFTLQQEKGAKPGRQVFPWGWGHMPQGLGMLVLDSMARIREKLVILFCLCEHEYLGLKRGAGKGRGLIAKEAAPIPGRSLPIWS